MCPTEELIAQLGPLCRGKVGVIARWSSMVFKGSLQRAREIGEALHADHLLEGSVRRDGARVGIIARLIETASESELWSKTYERTADDWLGVQADVASLVARFVDSGARARRAIGQEGGRTSSSYVPAAYLRGRYHWANPDDSGLMESLRGFRRGGNTASTCPLCGRAQQVGACEAWQRGVLPRAATPGAAHGTQVERIATLALRPLGVRGCRGPR